MKVDGSGLRYDTGKPRFDLLHPKSLKGLVCVLTKGAQKYSDRNWEKGMPWSKVYGSLMRHIVEILDGNDFDAETGELHADHVQCNAHFMSAYYWIFPQGDDRMLFDNPRIGLDVDGVLADFWGGLIRIAEERGIKYVGTPVDYHWSLEGPLKELYFEVRETPEFWLGLNPLVKGSELQIEPVAYVSARGCDPDITAKWLAMHDFPPEKVFHTYDKTKSDVCKDNEITFFADDCYEHYVELNRAGIFTSLVDRPHNRKYNVGHKRIYHPNQLVNRSHLILSSHA